MIKQENKPGLPNLAADLRQANTEIGHGMDLPLRRELAASRGYGFVTRFNNGGSAWGIPAEGNGFRYNNGHFWNIAYLIDRSGERIVADPFKMVRSFSEDRARVEGGFIDPAGKLVIKGKFYYPSFDFSDAVAAVTKSSGSVFIDKNGKVLFGQKFMDVKSFNDGLAPVKMPIPDSQDWQDDWTYDDWTYIDINGQQAIDGQFFWASEFSGGIATVVRSPRERSRLIDQQGREIRVKQDIWRLDNPSEGFVWGRGREYDYLLDNQGTVILRERSGSMPEEFHEGFTTVYDGNGRRYMDRTGHTLHGRFSTALAFKEDFALTRQRGRWAYIDRTGRRVKEFSHVEDDWGEIEEPSRIRRLMRRVFA